MQIINKSSETAWIADSGVARAKKFSKSNTPPSGREVSLRSVGGTGLHLMQSRPSYRLWWLSRRSINQSCLTSSVAPSASAMRLLLKICDDYSKKFSIVFNAIKSACLMVTRNKLLQRCIKKLEMWANAKRDGRPAEYRWRPLFNAAKFGWRPLLVCRAVTLPRREARWNLQGCPKLTKRSQPLVGREARLLGVTFVQ